MTISKDDIIPLLAAIIACIALPFAIYNCVISPVSDIQHRIRLRIFGMMMALIAWLGGLNGLIYQGTTENVVVSSTWLSIATFAFIGLGFSIRDLRRQNNYLEINAGVT